MRAPSAPLVLPEEAAGALGNDRLLGMTGNGIADGTSLRGVGAVAGALLLLGALFPAVRGHSPFTDGVTNVAVTVPLVLGVMLLALAVPRRGVLPPVGVAGLLGAGGLVVLLLGLTPFGAVAMTATRLPALVWLGVAVAAVGVAVRVLRPIDPYAAGTIAVGTLLFVVGGLLPHESVHELMPLEFGFLPAGTERGVIGAAWDGLAFGPLALSSAMQLVPLVMLPLATALAFRRPAGLWDAPGNALRALGVAIVLWLPLVFAVAAVDHAFLPRARLAVLAAGAMLALTAGTAALYIIARGNGRIRSAAARAPRR
jgi:hypothetical protein